MPCPSVLFALFAQNEKIEAEKAAGGQTGKSLTEAKLKIASLEAELAETKEELQESNEWLGELQARAPPFPPPARHSPSRA